MSFRKAGRVVFNFLPGEQYAFGIYEWVLNRVVSRSWRPAGFHTVSIPPREIGLFEIWLPVAGRSQRAQLRGEYETEVTELLSKLLDSDSVFWEVGGGFGFHSLAWAQVAETVVTFEANPEKAGKIKASAERNNYENIRVVSGFVGEDISLETYEAPDVILLDVEGAELRVLEDSPNILRAGPDWVVEVHDTSMFDDGNGINPEPLYALFEQAGYRWEKLSERKPGNYHVHFTHSP